MDDQATPATGKILGEVRTGNGRSGACEHRVGRGQAVQFGENGALQVELFRQVLLHVVGLGDGLLQPAGDADAGQDDIRRLVQQARAVEVVEPGPDDAERLFGLGL